MTSAHWIDGGFGPTDALGYTSYFFGPYEVAPVAAAAWLNAAGSLSMTAHDLATWTIALMEHHVVPAADTAILWQPRLLADKENPGYGLGFSLGAFNGHRQVAHGGELVGYQSSETMFPDDDTSIIVFANATPSDVSSTIAHAIAEYIYGSAAPRGCRPSGCSGFDANVAREPRARPDRPIVAHRGLQRIHDAPARRGGGCVACPAWKAARSRMHAPHCAEAWWSTS